MAKDTVTENITIGSIELKKTKTGKPYWSIISDDGEYYTAWSKSIADKLASFGKDTTVSISVEINEAGGKTFKNILGIESEEIDGSDFLQEMGSAVDEEPAPTPAPRPAAKPTPAPVAPPSVSPIIMARSIGIQVAAQLVASGKAPTEQLIPAAERATKYILDGVPEQKTSSGLDVNPTDYVGG